MAQAMLKGILAKGIFKAEDIIVSRRSAGELQKTGEEFGVCTKGRYTDPGSEALSI